MNKSRQSSSGQTEEPPTYDTVGSVETNVADGFTLIAVGDVILSRPLLGYGHAGFDRVVDVLRTGDVTFGNLETNIFDVRSFQGNPQAEYGGAYHVSVPAVAPDLKTMGFNLMSYANNHTFDWGVEGMRETCRALNRQEIIFAGVGETLSQAGAARFLETPRGRVALVAFASTFTPMSRACDPAGEASGRPGINPLRLREEITVPKAILETLSKVREALPNYRAANKSDGRVRFAGATFAEGESVGYSYKPNSVDVKNIIRNVRRGKQFSDFCIVTNHQHQPGNWSQQPPDFERTFAHQLIDAGADAFIVHGPHQLRGIELYKGRPILYSVGNFVMDDLRTPVGADMFAEHGKDPTTDTDADVTVSEMQNGYEMDPSLSDPVFYESVIAISRFEKNKLSELRLIPIQLGRSLRFANRGIPSVAAADAAISILKRLQRLSEPFGTNITIEGEVGFVRP